MSSTLRLGDGDLVTAGGLEFSEFFGGASLAVVGGTGMFAGTRGIATFTAPGNVSGKDGFFLSIDITTG